MTDEEMLSMAAKSIGLDVNGFEGGAVVIRNPFEICKRHWNPSTSNSDSFQLMVKLGLDVNFYKASNEVAAVQHHGKGRRIYVKVDSGDWAGAVREAIFRVAVAVGRGDK